MKDFINNIGDLEKIINKCEQSKIESFYYKDTEFTLQFSKQNELKETLTIQEEKNSKISYKENKSIDNKEDAIFIELKETQKVIEDNIITIKSPYVGYIELSKKIKINSGEIVIEKGDSLCSIEAMKLYNDIISPVNGRIVEILVENSSFVEFEQPIMMIREDKYE